MSILLTGEDDMRALISNLAEQLATLTSLSERLMLRGKNTPQTIATHPDLIRAHQTLAMLQRAGYDGRRDMQGEGT